jgi:hypothetical protein
MKDSLRIAEKPITYSTYQNTTNGVSIQYPLDWIKNQTQVGRIYKLIFVQFFSPNTDFTGSTAAGIALGIDNQPKSLDLKQYLQDSINQYKNSSVGPNFHLIQSTTNYTLAGRPAYEFIVTDNSTGKLAELINTGTFVGPKVYYITTFVNPNLLPYYAPILNHMKDSFSITFKTNATSAAGTNATSAAGTNATSAAGTNATSAAGTNAPFRLHNKPFGYTYKTSGFNIFSNNSTLRQDLFTNYKPSTFTFGGRISTSDYLDRGSKTASSMILMLFPFPYLGCSHITICLCNVEPCQIVKEC